MRIGVSSASAPRVPHPLLYVIESLAPSGATEVVRQLVTYIDRRRFAPQVLAVSARFPGQAESPEAVAAEERGVEQFRELGVPSQRLDLDPRGRVSRRIRPVIDELRRRRIDIVHAHSRPADLWTILAGVAAHTPVRLYSRQATYGELALRTRARYALLARLASRVVAVSAAVQEHLRTREGVPRERIELIPDAVDLDALARVAPAELTRTRLGIPPDAPLVGTVAALTARKGQRFLIDAAQLVLERFPRTRFLLVGEGPERADLERRIRATGRPEAFHLLGWRDDFADLIAALDVFVLPSLWEGLNLSLLSACALGRAVVATNLLSNCEVIDPGISGLLPTPARPSIDARELDSAALGRAIARLLADPALRQQLGEAARRRTAARFGARAMTASHEALYERLVRGARGRGPVGMWYKRRGAAPGGRHESAGRARLRRKTLRKQ
jgi:glycosyltransferase involved in cell wall biosynthesis